MRLSQVAHLRDLEIMVITLALLVLWILSMYFYLPLPVVVLLFAALATGATMTVWQAWMARKQRLATIGEQDSKS
jgi:Flp pilus assembly protein TadB